MIARPLGVPGATPMPPEYQIGDVATADLFSPIHLIVMDHGRTEKLREQEAQRTPWVYRFDPSAGEQAEGSLRLAFASARQKFLDALEANYTRRNLNAVAVTYPRFQRVVTLFQEQFKNSPVTTNLAALWATGGSDEALQAELASKLRAMMRRPIRSDVSDEEGSSAPDQAKIISVRANESAPPLSMIEKQGLTVFQTNFLGLSRARMELQASFPIEEQEMGNFLAACLKENCVLDKELTRELGIKNAKDIWGADEFEPGQLILRRGAVVDARMKFVLDQLRERMSAELAKKELVQEQKQVQSTVERLQAQLVRAQTTAQIAWERNRWLTAGIAGSLLGLLLVFWGLARSRHRSRTLLPARISEGSGGGPVVSCPCCSSTIVLPLELVAQLPQAISAPEPAALPGVVGLPAKANGPDVGPALPRAVRVEREEPLRPGPARPLGRLLASLVRGLALDRRELLETQKKAEQDLAKLEQRLAAVQAPLEERLKAYEERIVELEKDLSAKGEENRELIRATIAVTRKKLEIERDRERLAWG